MTENPMDTEIAAMQGIAAALDPLDEAARTRVVTWAAARFEVSLSPQKRDLKRGGPAGVDDEVEGDDGDGGGDDSSEWEDFADLFDAAGPTTEPKRLLVAAYWVQVVEGASQFGSFQLNKMLKDLGHGATHTAMSMDNLIQQKPALILQLKKSGKSQQGRKTYKLTKAGATAVLAMVNGA
jgi:hypothetical protein